MNALSDPQLLRTYADRRSEAAFAELVRRHIDLVHSAAFRTVNDPHLAKDVTQGVFVALAKDAGKLTDHPVLSGWLHRTARNIAAQTVRTEVRRRTREKEAAVMNECQESDAPWEEIAPHLDAALAELSEPDRDAVLLRYFENKPAQEMAAILGISAEAAQKRVSRAVERLRENFAKRGITTGAAGLTGIISANAVQVAPVGMAATLSATALASAAVSTAITATQTLSMTLNAKALAAAAITLVAGAGIYHFSRVANSPAGLSQALAPSVVTPKRRSADGNSLVENMVRTRSEALPIDQRMELEKLKEKWIDGERYIPVAQIQESYRFEKLNRNESSISLGNDRISMNLKIGSPECSLNNIKIILSKPVVESEEVVYVSSTDLAGLLDPMLRPTQIAAAGEFKTVILDPAHGGKDPGFSNELGTESDFTFKIANLTKQQLEAKGFTVVLTRSDDEDASPEERLNLANKVEAAAIFVSISFNSGAATENGIQTFLLAGGQDLVDSASVALSAAIHGSMIRKLDKNTSDGGIKRGESGVFSRIKHPAVLVKPGFMTHPTDSRSIADASYQAAVAKAIVEGISKYRFAVSRIPPQVKSGNAPDPE